VRGVLGGFFWKGQRGAVLTKTLVEPVEGAQSDERVKVTADTFFHDSLHEPGRGRKKEEEQRRKDEERMKK